MSSRTKKPIIDAKSKEEADNLETTFDLYKDLSDYERMIKEENSRKKNRLAREIAEMAPKYLDEIDEKFKQKDEDKITQIEVILKTSGDKYGKPNQLYDMSYEEIKSIYLQLEDAKKPWYKKLFELFM